MFSLAAAIVLSAPVHLMPLSSTATAITGETALNERQAATERAGEGTLSYIGTYWRDWATSGAKSTADLFSVIGNLDLCNAPVTFVAVYRTEYGIGISAFDGASVPHSSADKGLCGTFAYTQAP